MKYIKESIKRFIRNNPTTQVFEHIGDFIYMVIILGLISFTLMTLNPIA